MMKAAAMRFMHLGYKVHVVGETTSPAIRKGDVLIAGSGSGTTGGIVGAAKTAKIVGAKVVCFTTNMDSPLALLANYSVKIPAAQKQLKETRRFPNNTQAVFLSSRFYWLWMRLFKHFGN
ncbi:SIS domain-containing protein [Zobellia nedashkovskayae]